MKKTVSLLLIVLSTSAYTQETSDQINQICQEYDDQIRQAEEEGAAFLTPSITINSTLNKRAIGLVKHTIELYFDEHEEFEAPDEYEEYAMPYKYATLRKAIVTFESGSYNIIATNYFDKNGYLVKFHIVETGYECYEESTYFNEHEPIRITHVNSENKNCADPETKDFDKTKLSSEELANAKLLVVQAEKYREILADQYDLIKY